MLYIGSIRIPGHTALAPMAGVADRAFRQVCIENGAALTYTEMVSAKGLVYGDRKSRELLLPAPGERVFAAQIFGHEPDIMAQAAPMALALSGAPILDINMGCPTPKITGNGDGCALMRDLSLAAKVLRACVDAVDAPVTVKCRLGWDEHTVTDFARMAASNGAAAICVHGRTREQFYGGRADWAAVAAVGRAVDIPLIANGDVAEPSDARAILEATGAKLCMIGRGALGNPWLFARAEAAVTGLEIPPLPPLGQRLELAARHIALAAEYKGEHSALLEARHHLAWYVRGLPGAAAFRRQISQLGDLGGMRELLAQIYTAYADEA